MKRTFFLHLQGPVAVALADLSAGEILPGGHKVALRDIGADAPVLK